MAYDPPPSARLEITPPLARIGWLTLRGRQADAAELLLRSAYAYRDGGSAWDTFPEEWRRVARQNAKATLRDFINSIGNYPAATDLAKIEVPVVCTYGARSPDFIVRLTQSFAAAIPTASTHRIDGSAHAAPFDATTNFVQLIADNITPVAESGDTLVNSPPQGTLSSRGVAAGT